MPSLNSLRLRAAGVRVPNTARWISSELKRLARLTIMLLPSSFHSRTEPGPIPSFRRTSAGTEICPCAVTFDCAIGIFLYYQGNGTGGKTPGGLHRLDYGTSEVCRRSVSRNSKRLASRCLRTSTGHARRFASRALASRLPKSGRPVDHPRNPGWAACGSRARPPAIWSSRSERCRAGRPAKNETSAWLKTLANE